MYCVSNVGQIAGVKQALWRSCDTLHRSCDLLVVLRPVVGRSVHRISNLHLLDFLNLKITPVTMYKQIVAGLITKQNNHSSFWYKMSNLYIGTKCLICISVQNV